MTKSVDFLYAQNNFRRSEIQPEHKMLKTQTRYKAQNRGKLMPHFNEIMKNWSPVISGMLFFYDRKLNVHTHSH